VKTPPPLVVPAIKFVPVIVIVVSGDPAATEFGLIDPIAGAATLNTLLADEDVLVFFTVTLKDPAAASCVLVTAAVSDVALPGVVVKAVAPHITVELLRKLVPVTVIVKAALPAGMVFGLNEVIAGPLTVNLDAADVAPPGF
jgi:hypothetical protein